MEKCNFNKFPELLSLGLNLLSAILSATLLCLLLLSAGIESNPGPNNLQCKSCEFQTKSIAKYVRHQYLHSHDRRFKFYCPLCPRTFKALNPFRTHIHHEHPCSKPPPSQDCNPLNFQCYLCGKACPSIVELRKHLCSHISRGEPVQCPFPSCKRHTINPFSKVTNLRTHWSEFHKGLASVTTMSTKDSLNISHSEPPTDNFMLYELSDEESIEDQTWTDASYASRFQDYLAKFYLKLETVHHIPSSTVQKIAEDFVKISEMTQQSVATRLKACLEDNHLDEDRITDICRFAFDADMMFKLHHKGLSEDPLLTQHLRGKYYKTKFKYVAPEKPRFLGRNKFGKKRFVHYVPVKQSLEVFMEDESVRQQVRASFQRTGKPDVYADYTDGEACKPRFTGTLKKSIHFIFFQDALELVNPLGAARVKHKAIGVYYTIGNLSAKNRSKIHTLLLAQIFFEKDLKQFGSEKIFGDLLLSLKKLEKDGIMFDGESIPVIVVFMVGDNLGSHMIGGYQESFSVDYFCRYCEIDKHTFKSDAHMLPAPMRTVESYEKCVQEVKNCDVISKMGVKYSSVLNQLQYFHVCAPGLPPCVAHDFLLGVVPHDMQIFIKYFVSKTHWFTYETLNRRIATFQLKYNDSRNRPPTLTEKQHKITGSAAQNWNLLRFFSLMIGDLVRETDDPVWKLYLQLKSISNLVLAPKLHESQVTYMDTVLEEYLYDIAQCDEHSTFKMSFIPKHHFLRHYAHLTLLFGPLSQLWTLPFESKHSWVRQVALSSKNFIHVTKTIVEKHQLMMAYLCSDQLFSNQMECSSLSPLDISRFNVSQCTAIQELSIDVSKSFVVKVVGSPPVQYHFDQWIILRESDEGLNTGRIVANIMDESGCLHLLLDLYLAKYDLDFGHYVISGRFVTFPKAKLVPLDKLENFYPINHYILNGQMCLPLKYCVLRDEDLF